VCLLISLRSKLVCLTISLRSKLVCLTISLSIQLVCLSKAVTVTDYKEDSSLLHNKSFSVHYKSVLFYCTGPRDV